MKDPIFIVGKLDDGGGGSGKYALVTEAGYRVQLAVENNDLTATLYNKNSDVLSTVTVALPVAQSITGGYYDEETNEIVFVLADGNEIRLPADKLLKGLATETYVKDYVAEHGGKIDAVKVNGTPVEIIDRTVNLSIPDIEGLATEEFVNLKIEEVKELIPEVPTNVSAFTNDAGYLTEHQSIKTINGETLVGTGNVDIRTYQAMPNSWLDCTTMEDFINAIWETVGDNVGLAYVGTVGFEPLPEGVYSGELVVEIISDHIALFKLNSADTPPYNWYYNTFTEDFTWKLDSSVKYGYYNEDDGYMYYDEEYTNQIPVEPYVVAIDRITNRTYAVDPYEYDWAWHMIGGSSSSYEAGDNITISDNVISAVDTKYTAGNNINIDANNIISANIDLSAYAKLTDLQIGKTFTTNITVGHLVSGTVINSTDTLGDVLYNILYKEAPTGFKLYYGATTSIPSDLTQLNEITGYTAEKLIAEGLLQNVKSGNKQRYDDELEPDYGTQYTTLAASNDVRLTKWLVSGLPFENPFTRINKGDYSLYYLNTPEYNLPDGTNYQFVFEEAL